MFSLVQYEHALSNIKIDFSILYLTQMKYVSRLQAHNSVKKDEYMTHLFLIS